MANIRYILSLLCLVLFYYSCSIALTFFNRWCYTKFHYPLLVTFFQIAIISHVIWLYRSLTKATSCKDQISWELFIKKVCPTAITASMDIGLSNWSLMYITVSMYTMCKSTAIIFILLAAILFKLEKPKLLSAVVIGLISAGLFLFTYKATSFNLFGFILVMAASALGGLRWVLAQILLQRDSLGIDSTIEFVYYVEPIMSATLLPLAVSMEGSDMILGPHFMLADRSQQLFILAVVFSVSLLALLLTFSEYLLLSKTSSITLSICGIIKEIVILVIAGTVGDDKLSSTNIAGLGVCLTGISLHVYLKYKTAEQEESTAIQETDGVSQVTELKSSSLQKINRNGMGMEGPIEKRALLDSDESSVDE